MISFKQKENIMKNFLRIIATTILCFMTVLVISCGSGANSNDYKTKEPEKTSTRNIFYNSSSVLGTMIANKVVIYDDFSALINYTVNNKSIENDKEKIIEAIDNINKSIYAENDNKLYNQGNRVLYLKEESLKDIEAGKDSPTKKVGFDIYFTNLGYSCSYYKMHTLPEFIEAEDEKYLSATENKTYYSFIDKDDKAVDISKVNKPENFNILALENYIANTEITFEFDKNIIAFYSPLNKEAKIIGNTLTITPNSTSSRIYIMYQTVNQRPANWYIIGAAIGVAATLIILVIIKFVIIPIKRKKA